MKKLFIFDLDGTLTDSFTAIEKSLNYTLQALGYEKVSYDDAKRRVGKGDENFIRQFVKSKDAEAALRIYRKHHKKSLIKYTKLNPYVISLLSCLRRRGKIIAIASNRPVKFTNIILRHLDIIKYIDFVLCADQVGHLKPNPKIINTIINKFKIKKKAAVFIGDMVIDLETAKRARIDAIFVKGGVSKLKDIKKHRGVTIITSLKNIKNIGKNH